MKSKSKYRFFALLLPAVLMAVSCLCLPSSADLIPMMNAEILGGNSWFSGVSSSFSGNLNAEFMPVFEVNDNFSFIPVYSGSYRGVKTVSDLQGGGWLYQQAQDHSISFRFIGILPSDLTLKFNLSFLSELTQESPSEDWGLGLYNFNRTSFDFDMEKSFADLEYPFTLCAGYGAYGTVFPNYQSLASTDYGKSLIGGSSAPGTKVFDCNANEISVSFDILG